MTRKLAAVLIADVVGYSRHMELDDAGTHAQLKQVREHLIDPKIAEHGGHVVKTAGDGMLVEFGSAAAALRVAVDVQRALEVNNRSLPEDVRIVYRMGINLGDIIVDGADIFGDGVNVAARLQAIAEPGGICVSMAVREQVHGNFDVGFVDIGDQQVKNITRPIRVFRVDLTHSETAGAGSARGRWQRTVRSIGWRWAAAGAVALALGGVAARMLYQADNSPPVASRLPLSIVILPFASARETAADEQFADAVTEDLTMAFGRTRGARVVSYGLASTYKGKTVDARALGRELGVRYLVQGEVRNVDDRIVVKAQFVDATNGTQVWSDRMEVERARLEQERDQLVARLTGRLRDALNDAERRHAEASPPRGSSASDLVSHAQAVWSRDPNTIAGALAARAIFDQALRLDPGSVRALVGRARTIGYELDLNPRAPRSDLVRQLDELSSRAVIIDPNDPTAWLYRAEALWRQWRWDGALEANSRARQLDSTISWPLSQRALIMINIGRAAEGLALAEQALALDPKYPPSAGWPLLEKCIAYLALERYADAIASCEKSVAQDDWWLAHLYLVAAHAQLGADQKAATEKVTLMRQQPGFTIADFKAMQFSDNAVYWQQIESRLFPGLRRAGIPEK